MVEDSSVARNFVWGGGAVSEKNTKTTSTICLLFTPFMFLLILMKF